MGTLSLLRAICQHPAVGLPTTARLATAEVVNLGLGVEA